MVSQQLLEIRQKLTDRRLPEKASGRDLKRPRLAIQRWIEDNRIENPIYSSDTFCQFAKTMAPHFHSKGFFVHPVEPETLRAMVEYAREEFEALKRVGVYESDVARLGSTVHSKDFAISAKRLRELAETQYPKIKPRLTTAVNVMLRRGWTPEQTARHYYDCLRAVEAHVPTGMRNAVSDVTFTLFQKKLTFFPNQDEVAEVCVAYRKKHPSYLRQEKS